VTAKIIEMTRGIQGEVPVARFAMAAFVALLPAVASATPSPQAAKDCLRAAYMLYPYKRPGAAPMSGERLFFFRNCVAKRQEDAAPASDISPAPASQNSPATSSK
jgi:hypothetical protein